MDGGEGTAIGRYIETRSPGAGHVEVDGGGGLDPGRGRTNENLDAGVSSKSCTANGEVGEPSPEPTDAQTATRASTSRGDCQQIFPTAREVIPGVWRLLF